MALRAAGLSSTDVLRALDDLKTNDAGATVWRSRSPTTVATT
jgi:hypothetical protein